MECHIVARRPGGPRSGNISSREIDAYRNLILLCPTHHKEVDDQPHEYTIEALREIKRKHEEWVDETLEWRASLPDSFWAKVKKEAEELLLEQAQEVDGGIDDLVEGLGVFALMTAELLAAPELAFFIRGETGEVSLAFKSEEDLVFFAHADFDGFSAGFSTFERASAIEDYTDEVQLYREGASTEDGNEEEDSRIFLLAGSALLHVAEQVKSGEAVFYIRDTPPGDIPQLAFRVEGEDVLFAAGPVGAFDKAHEDFADADPIDITDTVRVKMFLDTYTQAMEEDDEDAKVGFIANYFAVSVLGAFDEGTVAVETGDEEKALFAKLLRDRFYEALLMLRAAHQKPGDPRIRAWVEENLDPLPPDGFNAALPGACAKAVAELAEEIGLDKDHRAKLEKGALDSLHHAILLFSRFDEDEKAQEPIAILTLERLQWWRKPEAGTEIAEMAHGTA